MESGLHISCLLLDTYPNSAEVTDEGVIELDRVLKVLHQDRIAILIHVQGLVLPMLEFLIFESWNELD